MAKGTKVKDPRWLRVDICRDFASGKCHRKESECRFAHPHCDCIVEKNKVTACYDSMKGKCNRENCKFYHPPFHIKEYLLAFGKFLEQQRLRQDEPPDSDKRESDVAERTAKTENSSATSTITVVESRGVAQGLNTNIPYHALSRQNSAEFGGYSMQNGGYGIAPVPTVYNHIAVYPNQALSVPQFQYNPAPANIDYGYCSSTTQFVQPVPYNGAVYYPTNDGNFQQSCYPDCGSYMQVSPQPLPQVVFVSAVRQRFPDPNRMQLVHGQCMLTAPGTEYVPINYRPSI
eukprot:Seg1980.8 transcript_id=Seg1980.8/GoldUCD/mRNA.D3Y31 product="Muscleblind-like protein" protein_id=Seg1980.8/GoldUCD/D3Y31